MLQESLKSWTTVKKLAWGFDCWFLIFSINIEVIFEFIQVCRFFLHIFFVKVSCTFSPLSYQVGVSKYRRKNSPITVKGFTQWKHHCCIIVPCFWRGVGLDDLWWSLPTQIILWFYVCLCACENSDSRSLPCELRLMKIAGTSYKCGVKPTCMQVGLMKYLFLNMLIWQLALYTF